MTNVKLPKQLDPVKSAQKRAVYDGVYLCKDLTRFNDAVSSVLADVSVKVEFNKDAQGLIYFAGIAKTDVSLICQRCNKSFNHAVNADFCFSPVQGQEQAEVLPDVYEPVEVNDHGEIDFFQLVEDELILALPIVALHAREDCAVKEEDLQFGKLEPEQERKNPFAVLKELKRD